MSFAGKTLGHFDLLASIGRGGMGEVYRARDRKLDREVAIKVLPEEFTRDGNRVARFQREAKLLASLNHPNIAAIHGLEESGGIQFLVLELVEGETLADRLKRGPIPADDSLKLALQIADALEAAHEKGVIHRDLKPANIKVTPEGKVKVLDFGLAKAFAEEKQEATLTYSPTLSELATQKGVILGTAAYMSPEQAKARTVDKRTDIWAFGVVLYEMLTGRQLFASDTVLDTLAGVLRKEPDWEEVPARVRPLLRRCLQKDPNKRLRDIGDVKIELAETLANPNDVLDQRLIAVAPERKLLLGFPWIGATAILSLLVGGVAVWKLKPTEPRQVVRFSYEIPDDIPFNLIQGGAVSPDGRKFVISTSKGLYLHPVDELTAKFIAGTEGNTRRPFFSPDGKWIGYYSATDRKLKKIAVNGGTPVPLCDVAGISGAWWNDDNTIAYGQGDDSIMRISANGGTPESIARQKSRTLADPQILPDGKSVMYTAFPMPVVKIMVQSLKSGETKELFRGVGARYLPTGHIVFMSPDNNTLFAVPFDLDRLQAKSGPVATLEGVGSYVVSESGTLAYIPGASGAANSRQTLVWVNREGKEEPLSAAPNQYTFFRISPDGKRVALTVGTPPKDHIWIWDAVRETMTRLTLDEGTDNMTPLWTPDGKRIVYTSSRENLMLGDIYSKASDGTGEAEKLASSPGRGLVPWSWSKDGRTLVLWEFDSTASNQDIGMLAMEGNHLRKPLLQEKHVEHDPRISPDGRWLAYASNESGKVEVYVRPFPEVNKNRWQVSTSGGNNPLWSLDGRELFYHTRDAAMAVPVETAPTFNPGKPTVLFRGTHSKCTWLADYTYWDISPDGKHFLMMKEAATEAPRKINIVLNWIEELKQRVPAK